MLTPLLERFAEHFPIPTMARALLERSFHREQLDAWLERQAEGQYTRTLLFSTLFELMMQVVTRRQPSVNAAYQGMGESIPVSLKAVYDKLNGLEPKVSAGLVGYSAQQAREVIEALEGERPPPPGCWATGSRSWMATRWAGASAAWPRRAGSGPRRCRARHGRSWSRRWS